MPTIAEEFTKSHGKRIKAATSKLTEPLWKGPQDKGSMGGITFSMLSRFLVCRERFRLMAIEGWRTSMTFDARSEYGNMWHICEELHAAGKPWEGFLKTYAIDLCKTYPTQQEQVDQWYRVCKAQFPVYVSYWRKHPDMKKRSPLFEEQTIHQPYCLPSGRTIWLRGKMDSVDVVKGSGIWLQENKTKGRVDERMLSRQLKFDLQTMMYMTALYEMQDNPPYFVKGKQREQLQKLPIAGVRYNVIRRPLTGGKGSIKPKKANKTNKRAESKNEFYERLGKVIKAEAPSFFMRWNTVITKADVVKFRKTCLDPILENLCDWYAEVTNGPWTTNSKFGYDGVLPPQDYRTPMNWRHPYGVYNVLNEGGSTDLDDMMDSGSRVGLTRVRTLFTELQNAAISA